MKLRILYFLLLVSSFTFAADLTQSVSISRKDFLEFKTNAYVAGFNRYDTSILITDLEIRVSVYLNYKQPKRDAENLLKRMKSHLEIMLNQYDWAKGMKVHTEVYYEKSQATDR